MSIARLPALDANVPSWNPAHLHERDCPFCASQGERRFVRPDELVVRHCSTCGAFFVSPVPDQVTLDRFYTAYSTRYRRRKAPHPRAAAKSRPWDDFRLVEIASHLDLRGKRVLDVGCGWGVLLKRFEALGAHVTGIDVDPSAVRFAQDRLRLSTVRTGVVDDLPAEQLFDVICMCDFIEHPIRPAETLQQALVRLAPKGMLVIWTPNASHAHDEEQPVLFRVDQEHMQYLSATTCHWLAAHFGMELVHLEAVGFPGLGPRNGRGIVGSARRALAGLRGAHVLRALRRRFSSDRSRDPRAGTYHLFCILRKRTSFEQSEQE
jgi:2-polyprenyl-3-methyl-5-hydroxy-6-metoxy-1,4-benzoquinol methylase